MQYELLKTANLKALSRSYLARRSTKMLLKALAEIRARAEMKLLAYHLNGDVGGYKQLLCLFHHNASSHVVYAFIGVLFEYRI